MPLIEKFRGALGGAPDPEALIRARERAAAEFDAAQDALAEAATERRRRNR